MEAFAETCRFNGRPDRRSRGWPCDRATLRFFASTSGSTAASCQMLRIGEQSSAPPSGTINLLAIQRNLAKLPQWLRFLLARCAGDNAGAPFAACSARDKDHRHLHPENSAILTHDVGGLCDHFQRVDHFAVTSRHYKVERNGDCDISKSAIGIISCQSELTTPSADAIPRNHSISPGRPVSLSTKSAAPSCNASCCSPTEGWLVITTVDKYGGIAPLCSSGKLVPSSSVTSRSNTSAGVLRTKSGRRATLPTVPATSIPRTRRRKASRVWRNSGESSAISRRKIHCGTGEWYISVGNVLAPV